MSAEIVPGFAEERVPASARWLGMELLSWDRETMSAHIAFNPPRDVINFGGVIQGGFLVSMMDDAMGFNTFISLGMKAMQASIDIHAHFFRPVAFGRVEVRARVVRSGRSVAFLEAELFDREGVLAARAVSSTKLTPFGQMDGGREAAQA